MIFAAAVAALVLAQSRPDEADMFGTPTEVAADAGTVLLNTAPLPDADGGFGGSAQDNEQLSSGPIQNKFETDEIKTDPLKVGASLLLSAQFFWQEGKAFEKGSLTTPFILDAFIDGRPNDRVRAFAVARLQFDPTRPLGNTSTSTSSTTTSSSTGSSLVGLTPATSANPSVFLDQLWLRFDIMRKVYMTVGRQKVRWGVSRIWYPTDFLNSQPRDALNPFDVRLGVNMIKAHVPIESLGWNFYAYALLDGINLTSTGEALDQLGGALRGEFVLGPAELTVSGVWQKGRRPRYAADISTSLGPIDVYAEAAFRSAADFLKFKTPSDLTADNFLSRVGDIEPYRPTGFFVQVSGGVSWQFNYTDKNMGILGVEYFYNPAGYSTPIEYQVQTFMPSLIGQRPDPIQQVSLYGGQHNIGVSLTLPGIPQFTWITINLSNIIILNDPAALTRLDLSFRVLTYLTVQVFGSVFYGQTGGQLRFKLTPQVINDIANVSEAQQVGSGAAVRTNLSSLRYPALVQAGVLLRVSI